LDEAFLKNGEDFLTAYGFPKPEKSATNVVVACQSGRRALAAIEKLKILGYSSLK
jgi:rhodanese-related sulfurtransferase